MASVQELLLAAEAKKSPFISFLEGAAQGFGHSQNHAVERARQLIALEEERKQAEYQTQMNKRMEAELAGRTEDAVQAKLGGIGNPNPVLPTQKLQRRVSRDGRGNWSESYETVESNSMNGTAPLNSEQLAALESGDTESIAKAFPSGLPLQALRYGTMFGSRKDQEAEREAKRKDKRNDERTKIVDRFNADASVKKAQQSIDAANTIRGLVDSGNPIAAAAIPTFMARASGEVGNLSEADKQPFGGSQAIYAKIEAAAKQAADGKLTAENAKFITDLSNIMEKRAQANIDKLARLRAKQYSGASDFMGESDIYATLRPSFDAPEAKPTAPVGKYKILGVRE